MPFKMLEIFQNNFSSGLTATQEILCRALTTPPTPSLFCPLVFDSWWGVGIQFDQIKPRDVGALQHFPRVISECSSLITHHSPLITHHSSLTTHDSWLINYHSSPLTQSSRVTASASASAGINQHQSMTMCLCHCPSRRKSMCIGIHVQNTR